MPLQSRICGLGLGFMWKGCFVNVPGAHQNDMRSNPVAEPASQSG